MIWILWLQLEEQTKETVSSARAVEERDAALKESAIDKAQLQTAEKDIERAKQKSDALQRCNFCWNVTQFFGCMLLATKEQEYQCRCIGSSEKGSKSTSNVVHIKA